MPNTLISKIAAASLKVGALETDKTNVQQNYKYISADKVLERAGDALAAAGVVIIPSLTNEAMERVDTGNNKARYDSTVTFEMHVTDGESELLMLWYGRGSDYMTPDKALYKAITSGHKYFLMKLLNIGVGNEDGEHEVYEAAQAAQDAETRAQAKRPAQPQADVIFDKPPRHAVASQQQLDKIAELGAQVYAGEWESNHNKLAEWASGGARQTLEALFDIEAQKLIKALEKKVAA